MKNIHNATVKLSFHKNIYIYIYERIKEEKNIKKAKKDKG